MEYKALVICFLLTSPASSFSNALFSLQSSSQNELLSLTALSHIQAIPREIFTKNTLPIAKPYKHNFCFVLWT